MSGFVEGLCSTTRDRPGSSGCLRRQGPSIMHISGCLGRAGAEQISCASAGVWGASNPVQSKSNEIKFRWTCEKQIHGGGLGGGGRGVAVAHETSDAATGPASH